MMGRAAGTVVNLINVDLNVSYGFLGQDRASASRLVAGLFNGERCAMVFQTELCVDQKRARRRGGPKSGGK